MTIHEKLDYIMNMDFAIPITIKTWGANSGYGQKDAYGTLILNTQDFSKLTFGAVTTSTNVGTTDLQIKYNGSTVYTFSVTGNKQTFDISSYDEVSIIVAAGGSSQYASVTLYDISLEK